METGKSRVAGARKLTRPLKPCTFEPIHWDVREFCLVESVTHEKGARYRVMQSWELGTAVPVTTGVYDEPIRDITQRK